ncbi:hypothetical protein Tco_0118271 [Tanacetum coccineum]
MTSDSSPYSSSERSLDSSSPFARPSRKRCRFPTTLVPLSTLVSGSIAPALADLLPRKRFKDSLDALDFAAGGNFLDKMPQKGLAIIESKSKVCYSISRANDSRVSTDAPLSNSSPPNNSFDIQQIAASLEDKMTIKMKQMMNEMKALVVRLRKYVSRVDQITILTIVR